ncbi:hypothetical protein B4923_18575 [Brenneria roseae subsp. americana]|uniref:Uncharacterized protein n=1 Tax=Brenneria roseae subsp. americana TaxID=1508507 RepID=A0A2U1TKD9_9GAMM|nr:DUF6515 family protein [Brenneria roseae]PWC09888.1 hypothetical protein B4923_18575 [Brenneria roseae subsp. americana]
MKKNLVLIISLAILSPASVLAGPGPGHGMGPGPHGAPWHDRPGPGIVVDRLPYGVETVLIAGLTYYVLNGIFYQRQNNSYVVVETPPATAHAVTQGEMTVLDINGERFYVKNGSYYKRNINGEYLEVPKPAGL